tara:strand:- start:2783 stop:3988 length:1206 start_codon:yes stop_codon:yes gene_type:complete
LGNKSIYDASASALGYIYQVRYALLLALKKLRDVDDPDNCVISIEKLDDIAFEDKGTPTELLQAKYHGTPGNLSDRSSDWWKTIRIWSDMMNDPKQAFEAATFSLITTESAASGTIASMLGLDKENRDVDEAMKAMQVIAAETGNLANKAAYKAFNLLETWQQKKLLNSTYVICNSPTIIDVDTKIKKELILTVSDIHVDAFSTRLEGMWFKRAIEVMSSKIESGISLGELRSIVDDLRTQFLPSNLPSDYDEAEPEYIDIDSDDRVFVEQLRLLGVSDRVIKLAIINYYRAFEQRSRWSRDGLVMPGELKSYMNSLEQEWEHYASLQEMDYDQSKDSEKIASGRNLYKICQTEGAKPIRPEFKSGYVARGTYHELSDNRKIGWHPDYSNILQPLNDKGVA